MQNTRSDTATVGTIDVKKLLDENQDIVILDVRTPEEVSKGKIPKSINVPLSDIEKKMETIIPDKKKRIYVYCLSGSRSIIAAEMMKNMGYNNVFNIQSGMLSWRANKYPTED